MMLSRQTAGFEIDYDDDKILKHLRAVQPPMHLREPAMRTLFTPEVIQNFRGTNLAEMVADSCDRIIRRSRLQATG